MIIGVAAVIAMVSIGRGASAAVQEQIGKMGNDMLISDVRRLRRSGARASHGDCGDGRLRSWSS